MRRTKPPNRGGRPSKLTTTAALALVAGALRGDSLEDVARAAGIGPSTLYRWLALGRRGAPTFSALADAVREARSAAGHGSTLARLAMAMLRRGF